MGQKLCDALSFIAFLFCFFLILSLYAYEFIKLCNIVGNSGFHTFYGKYIQLRNDTGNVSLLPERMILFVSLRGTLLLYKLAFILPFCEYFLPLFVLLQSYVHSQESSIITVEWLLETESLPHVYSKLH